MKLPTLLNLVTLCLIVDMASAQDVRSDFDRAHTLFETHEKPLESFEQRISEGKGTEWDWHFLARARMEARDLYGATRALERAKKLAPKQALHSWQLGLVAERRLNQSAAVSHFDAAIETERNGPQRKLMQRHRLDRIQSDARLQAATSRNLWAMILMAVGGAFVLVRLRRS